jgi:tRNA nucleotidyltransferase (CCA-adding enzyme)
MHIVLTHEQADFDALASLLGGYLLEEHATPILPRRMNRNVRAFYALYGADLPFVDPTDLPAGVTIEAVTLVDTQSMVSIRGMQPVMAVHVIDHHPLREDLPTEWKITVSGTGANTTIFIELLRERDIVLNPIQATLLLLGIYEDTGSLTFSRTTARDLRAASFLLEQGASLRIASDYLNHPLSQQQQMVYDTLRANARYEQIHGHTVILTSGDASEMDEELSTIAHKLRDLLDPDALFLLIATRGGVQIIARSTSDQINVAEIAAHFGGGGHDRAAAGLIRERSLDDIYAELLRILPDYIRPAVTVAQIMSPNPQLLAPDTPVAEAAERMQRYGYEGYPIVREGRVVGLLTRRDVDRAMSHNYKVTAASLMKAGEYTVRPDDSIEHLQRLMTDSGWGQIPVVQPESGQIVGIVTRTDLIKTLTDRTSPVERANLADRLEAALIPERLALLKVVAQEAARQRVALYIVGGFVRDLLLDRPSIDFDLVVEGDAISLAKALSARFGGRVTGHARFGTAKWHLGAHRPAIIRQFSADPGLRPASGDFHSSDLPASLDLITARTEFYTYPTALPTVERSSIKLDLHRRDFTINTLAIRLDGRHYGELHDYWGGLADLRRGLVRVLHSLSFVDDPTRMLRAVRFEQRFGFSIEKRTAELLGEALALLGKVSGERITHELDHILAEPSATQMLARLDELKLLSAIHPALTWDDWLRSRLEALAAREIDPAWELAETDGRYPLKRQVAYLLWLLRLPVEQAVSVASRLKLRSDLRRAIQAACRLWADLRTLRGSPPSKVVDRLEDVPALAIYAVYLASDQPDLCASLETYVLRWRHITPTINGTELRRRGLRPGPAYRVILEKLRHAWLDGEITSPEQEAALLEALLAAEGHKQRG